MCPLEIYYCSSYILYAIQSLQIAAKNLMLPDPFPVPMLKEEVEKSLIEKKLCGDDRKYIVRVLATVLLTHVQKPSKKHCEVVAKALVRKFPFLKEYVSMCLFACTFVHLCFFCMGGSKVLPCIYM